MNRNHRIDNTNVDLPHGIHRRFALPNAELSDLWDSIIISGDLKARLLAQAVLSFSIRGKVKRSVLPLHGLILLVGEPGTGKTSLARGLAARTAKAFKETGFQLLEIDPHSLMSAAMGKSQKAVVELFSQSIRESAANGPTIVLLDEVETLAASRARMSLEANPIDIHRATDAVLVQLDILAEEEPKLLFVATSNFRSALDEAFVSRCDLVIELPLPDKVACKTILSETLSGLAATFPALKALLQPRCLEALAAECTGLNGRAIRKAVGAALASSPETALDPNLTTEQHVIAALRASRAISKA